MTPLFAAVGTRLDCRVLLNSAGSRRARRAGQLELVLVTQQPTSRGIANPLPRFVRVAVATRARLDSSMMRLALWRPARSKLGARHFRYRLALLVNADVASVMQDPKVLERVVVVVLVNVVNNTSQTVISAPATYRLAALITGNWELTTVKCDVNVPT
jgi:hypothetical protein